VKVVPQSYLPVGLMPSESSALTPFAIAHCAGLRGREGLCAAWKRRRAVLEP
jgi:hypothetical protein